MNLNNAESGAGENTPLLAETDIADATVQQDKGSLAAQLRDKASCTPPSVSTEDSTGDDQTANGNTSKQQKQQDFNDDEETPGTENTGNGTRTSDGSDKDCLTQQDQSKDRKPKLARPEVNESCPRCHSADTKFCYYNNYCVKQPRFFCKACQRYWTSGGTLRNVAPGAGRRKSKSASSKSADKMPEVSKQQGGNLPMSGGSVAFAPGPYANLSPLLADPLLAYNVAAQQQQQQQQQQLLANLKLQSMSSSWCDLNGQAAGISSMLDPRVLSEPTCGLGLPSTGMLGTLGTVSGATSEDSSLNGRRTRVKVEINSPQSTSGTDAQQVAQLQLALLTGTNKQDSVCPSAAATKLNGLGMVGVPPTGPALLDQFSRQAAWLQQTNAAQQWHQHQQQGQLFANAAAAAVAGASAHVPSLLELQQQSANVAALAAAANQHQQNQQALQLQAAQLQAAAAGQWSSASASGQLVNPYWQHMACGTAAIPSSAGAAHAWSPYGFQNYSNQAAMSLMTQQLLQNSSRQQTAISGGAPAAIWPDMSCGNASGLSWASLNPSAVLQQQQQQQQFSGASMPEAATSNGSGSLLGKRSVMA